MSFIAGPIAHIKGPSLVLPCKASVARIVPPDWPLLAETGGRKELCAALCKALALEDDDPMKTGLLQTADRSGPEYIAELLARTAITLQQVAGHPVSRFGTPRLSDTSDSLAAWEILLPKTGKAAGSAAERLIEAAAGSDGTAVSEVPFETASSLVSDVSKAIGNSVVEVLLAAAHSRGIPWLMIDPVWPMMAFGQGSRTKRLMTTMTELEGHISTLLTRDKMLSLQLLREAGFPVPDHYLVASDEAAVTAARKLGHTVVVKPLDQMRSRGVTVNLRSADAVRKAFRKASRYSNAILVESQLAGLPYRILVIGGMACAAMQRSRPEVTGDGSSTVRELIGKTNQERARLALKTAHGPRQINVENFREELGPCLAEQGLRLESVPEAGRRVALAFKGETGRGGENRDITEEIHPDNLAMAEAVAKVFELNVMGLDFMSEDIARSYKEVNCGINEVNAEPALSLHLSATSSPRNVVDRFFDLEFGAGRDGRIPVLCALGGDDGTDFDLLEAALAELGQQAGIAAGDDVAKVGRYHLPAGEPARRPAERVLGDTRVDCALISLASKDFAKGLAFDRCRACYLSRPPGRSDEAEPLAGQARLLAAELTETLIIPAADQPAWAAHLDLADRRVLLLAPENGGGGNPVTSSQGDATPVIRLSMGKELSLLYQRNGHSDCLARLAPRGAEDDGTYGALLLAAAYLITLDYDLRDVGRAVTTAWTHASRASQSRTAKRAAT